MNSHSRAVRNSTVKLSLRQDGRENRRCSPEEIKGPAMPIFTTNGSSQFPTEKEGSFAGAMSAIACKVEVGAQDRFNLVSGVMIVSKNIFPKHLP